jgi:hypothetical protein
MEVNNMYKSGLIFGIVMLFVALGVTLVLPYCVPCVALLLGLAAGYVAGVFGKPAGQPLAVRAGAIAGVIASIGVVIGEMAGAVINASFVKPENLQQLLQTLGISGGITMTSNQIWASQLGVNCFLSLVSVALMAGLGALGGLLWWNGSGKKQAVPPAFLPPQ